MRNTIEQHVSRAGFPCIACNETLNVNDMTKTAFEADERRRVPVHVEVRLCESHTSDTQSKDISDEDLKHSVQRLVSALPIVEDGPVDVTRDEVRPAPFGRWFEGRWPCIVEGACFIFFSPVHQPLDKFLPQK